MTECCNELAPCLNGECSGLDEVVSLLPNGRLWNIDDDRLLSRWFRGVGHWKSDLNAAICQEWAELNPCTSVRLLPYWAQVYSFPSCVEQTGERLCEWIELMRGDCPPGSVGFLRLAIEFVAPGVGITLANQVDNSGWSPAAPYSPVCEEPDKADFLITAPPGAFAFDEGEPLIDGRDKCGRRYWIPEIECLRHTVFPFGLSIAYQSDPLGDDGEHVGGVPDANLAVFPDDVIRDCSIEICGNQ